MKRRWIAVPFAAWPTGDGLRETEVVAGARRACRDGALRTTAPRATCDEPPDCPRRALRA